MTSSFLRPGFLQSPPPHPRFRPTDSFRSRPIHSATQLFASLQAKRNRTRNLSCIPQPPCSSPSTLLSCPPVRSSHGKLSHSGASAPPGQPSSWQEADTVADPELPAWVTDRRGVQNTAPIPPPPTPPRSAHYFVLTGEDKCDFLSCSAAHKIKFTGGLFPVQIILTNPVPVFVRSFLAGINL